MLDFKSVQINANLSQRAYTNWSQTDVETQTIAFTDSNNDNWEVYAISGNTGYNDGYYGVAFRNTQTDEVVVSFRGTDGPRDVTPDLQIAFGQNLPNQYSNAQSFYDEVLQQAEEDNYGVPSITGHSLGGGLAQLVGAVTGATTYTFNAPGVKSLLDNLGLPQGDYNNINNYNATYDPASEVGNQIGNSESISVSSHYFIPEALVPIFEILSSSLVAFLLDQHSIDSMCEAMSDNDSPLSDEIRNWLSENVNDLADMLQMPVQELSNWLDINVNKLADALRGPVQDLSNTLSNFFNSAQSAVLRRDPLTLDLDGDGLETVGINSANPILFDHTGEGIKTATGWIEPDDGFLVLDRNGNGAIDDGTELFGDSTPLFDENGEVIGKAEDGFAALTQEDTNGDGVVNAQDARFADLRIWRDLNSDGISQEGELQSLTEAGISAINVAKTENSQPLANGNLLADLGSYVRSDGSEGGVGSVSAELGDIDLAEDTFHSEFADSIPLTEEAQALPDMNGSGQVRTLSEAASLSPEVAAILDQYAQATTRSAQMALLDQLIVAWGETSELAVTGDGAYDGAETTVTIDGYREGSAGYEAWMTKLQTLERFNGRPFATPAEGAESVSINLFGARQSFLNQSWSALRQSVYDGLLLQTRLKPYLDAISLTVNESGLGIDFTGTAAAFADRHATAPGEAVRDLLDLQRISGTDLNGMGWDGYGQLRGWLAETVDSTDPTLNATLIAALGDFGYPGLQTDGSGTNASEAVIGDDAGATLNGEGGVESSSKCTTEKMG
jgi:hypothetical protein